MRRTNVFWIRLLMNMTAVEFGLVSADILADALWEYGEETDDGDKLDDV